MKMLRAAPFCEAIEIKRYHLVDLILAPPDMEVPGNPFDVEFAASFHGPAGRALTIPGFYDSEKGYVVRFSPELEGVWQCESHSDVPALDGLCGRSSCIPNGNRNLHGSLSVDRAHPQHFIYADGTRCFLMGYEVNWLMQIDQSPSNLTRIKALLDRVAGVGFNMVTVNSYAYVHPGRWDREEQEHDPKFVTPKIAPWVGGNDAPDYGRMNSAFFYHFDRVMLELFDRGILAHVMIHVYNKGVSWPELGTADDDRYWRYFVARYQAFPNMIWDPAKEAKYQPREYVWDRLATIRALDGYRRLLTVHDPSRAAPGHEWAVPTEAFDPRKDLSDAFVDFKSDQIHLDWYGDALRNYCAAQRPYVNIEYGYERGVKEIPTSNPLRMQHWREVLRRTWLVAMGGGYINYYYCNTAWSLFIPEPDPPGYSAHRVYRDFWLGTKYWLLPPHNSALAENTREGRYCRANVGQEYVVFDETGQGFDLNIAEASAPLHATWLNPVGGERVDAWDLEQWQAQHGASMGTGKLGGAPRSRMSSGRTA